MSSSPSRTKVCRRTSDAAVQSGRADPLASTVVAVEQHRHDFSGAILAVLQPNLAILHRSSALLAPPIQRLPVLRPSIDAIRPAASRQAGSLIPTAGLRRLDLDLLLSVASNVAEGMAYLHHHAPVKVVHCDLKPSNVLLDGDMTAVVSDFGISKLVMTDGARDPEVMGDASTSVCNSITRLLQGSVGYIAPEYGLGGRPSTQGDVYSFGVMLLEMISGKRPTDVISEEGHGLHDWAKKLFQHQQQDLDTVVERSLLPFSSPPRGEMEVVVVLELLELGVACTQLAPSMRPTMDDVAHELAYLRDGTWRNYGVTDLKTTDQKQVNSKPRLTV